MGIRAVMRQMGAMDLPSTQCSLPLLLGVSLANGHGKRDNLYFYSCGFGGWLAKRNPGHCAFQLLLFVQM